jgi:hypothetical protein
MRHGSRRSQTLIVAVLALFAAVAGAQSGDGVQTPVVPGVKVGGSSNVKLLGHIPLGGYFRVADVEIEQEPNRPYAYVGMMRDRAGIAIVDFRDRQKAKLLWRWQIENVELHSGLGGLKPQYFKSRGRYYAVVGLQFQQGTPDADLGAVVFDVTSLPDTTRIREVARIRFSQYPGGFHNIFAYKHSDGRNLLFTTVPGPQSNVYDLDKVVGGDVKNALIATVPIPDSPDTRMGNFGYHDFYVGYDPATRQDKFYGAGRGGFFVYDVTKPDQAKLLTSIVGASGMQFGHTFTPDPTGRFAVTETEYQYAPLRIFDLKEGLDGKVQTITRSVGAWTADWRALAHNHEVRWPYVFVSAYEDGLQVFNMIDPANPVTMGWYYTCHCKHQAGFGGIQTWEGTSVMNGAFGVDVRNADGTIAISDSNTGLWLFHMEGFDGWKGEDWSVPNVSSAQDWDRGPVKAASPKPLVP